MDSRPGRDGLDSVGTADMTDDADHADHADHGDGGVMSGPSLLTPEARTVTGVLLVVGGLLLALPEFLAMQLLLQNSGTTPSSPMASFLYATGGVGLFALLGVLAALPAVRTGSTPMMRGSAVAAVLVGALLVLAVAAGTYAASRVTFVPGA